MRTHRGCGLLTFAAICGAAAIALAPASRANAIPMPVGDPDPVPVGEIVATHDVEPHRMPRSINICRDELVQRLYQAGWRGDDLRIGYAIVWRESNNRPNVVGHGGYGLFQLQASAHADKWWWDWDYILDPDFNTGAAYQLWKTNGWRPWGLDEAGGLDARDYGSWSAWQIETWIIAPFQKYASQYDQVCGLANLEEDGNE